MNRLQFLLTKLAEEAAEIGQIALKTQQFGLHEMCPGLDKTNAQSIHKEIHDLLAIVYMLNGEFDFGYVEDMSAILTKERKVNQHYKYSQSLGMVE